MANTTVSSRWALLLPFGALVICCGTKTDLGSTLGASGTGTAAGTAASGAGGNGSGASGTGASGTAASGTGATGAGASSGGEAAGGSCEGVTEAGPIDCASYCDRMEDACKNMGGHFNDQYPGGYPDVCMAACAHFPVGSPGNTSGHSLACRIYYACLADQDPDTHCTHAGPGGDGACGENCESFCSLNLSICTGAQQQYATIEACETTCAAFDFTDRYHTGVESWSSDKNSFACRMYWLMRSVPEPIENCRYTKPGAVDGDPCLDG